MRIESIGVAEHLGSVKIYGTRRVLELDSGARPLPEEIPEVQKIGKEVIEDIERRLAIVLPIKNEDLTVFGGVLSGIPHDCLMIVVSNSKRGDVDIFASEQDILGRFCHATKRQSLIIHQKDPVLAEALKIANYGELIGKDGLVRNGKSEGMILGILLAMLHGKEYVGFIDTDNYIPGAVWEYVKHYTIGFSLAKSPYSMVRILWRYKPKIAGELYFKKWGRVSEISNKYLNHLLSTKKKFETEIIKTANAGEHAMSIELAKMLTYGTGYAVEVQEIISTLEQFGGILPIVDKTVAEKGVEIIQTETINPHLHEERGGEHLAEEMLLPSLSAIYHSPLCEPTTKHLIFNQLLEQGCLKSTTDEVTKVGLIPPPQKADMQKFAQAIEEQLPRYSMPRGRMLRDRFISAEFGPTGAAAKKVVFTDLDGTLLHPVTYSYIPALDTLRRLQTKGIPVVFCSAKTRAEQEVFRKELGIEDPFIVENGGAIFIPKDFFRLQFTYDKATKDYFVIELGATHQEVRRKLREIVEEAGCHFIGFDDMTVEEIARETGLSLVAAEFAKQREYSASVKIEGDKKAVRLALKKIKQAGFSCTFGGRFYEVTAGTDKGKAVKVLTEMFKLNFGKIVTVGIGDSESDLPMLEMVDLPVLVRGRNKRWSKMKLRKLYRVKGVGPEGWSMAMRELITD